MTWKQALALMSATLLLGVGCGGATLTLRSGREVRGTIVRSTATTIFVEDDRGIISGPREAVVDIDHPGAVEAALGLALAGAGGLVGAFAVLECGGSGSSCGGPVDIGQGGRVAIGVGIIGLGLAVYGLIRHTDSRSAAAPPEE